MSLKQFAKNTLAAPVFHVVRDVPWVVRGWFTPKPADAGPLPPLRLMFDGPRGYAAFRQMGAETLEFYKEVAGMRSSDTVLDIGCGIGRKTIPLLSYLADDALYVGMDIDRRGIDWLLRNVTTSHPNFVFLHLDIYNKFYNPKGPLQAGRLVFPFPDNSFDIIVLWSVFTHMYPSDVAHYLAEIARILKPGGKVVASYFLFNEEVLAKMGRNETRLHFSHELPNCRTTNPNMPEDAIALRDDWLEEVQRQLGLRTQTLLYGEWSGHQVSPKFSITNVQDIVVAVKS